jgi:hypothetical protein
VDGHTVRFSFAGVHALSEYLTNGPRGVEHGFLLDDASLPRSLCGSLADSPVLSFNVVIDSSGDHDIRYTDLYVYDAAGATVDSWMTDSGDGTRSLSFRLLPSTAFPVVIDPLIWSTRGQPVERLGFMTGPAGDVNGDGYADVFVGSGYYDGAAENCGQASIFFGSAGGLSTTQDWSFSGSAYEDNMGEYMISLGDVNGDGFDDVHTIKAVADWSGTKAYAFFGSSTGPSDVANWTHTTTSHKSFLQPVGDVNGDGFDDVVLTNGSFRMLYSPSKLELLPGSAAGISTTPTWSDTSGLIKLAKGSGDINGDGYDDVLAFSRDDPDVWYSNYTIVAYMGSAAGLAADVSWSVALEHISVVWIVGDVNGDGYDDILVGAEDENNYAGAAHLFHGGVDGPSSDPDWSIADQLGGRAGYNEEGDAGFGKYAGPAGDVDGDGYDDVVVTSWGTGRAFVYHGSATGLEKSYGWMTTADFNGLAIGVGDTNGDGRDELLAATSPGGRINGDFERGTIAVFDPVNSTWWMGGNQCTCYNPESVCIAGETSCSSMPGSGIEQTLNVSTLSVTTYELRLLLSDELAMDPRRFRYAPVTNSTATLFIADAEGDPACRHLDTLNVTLHDVGVRTAGMKVTSCLLVDENVSTCLDAQQLAPECDGGAKGGAKSSANTLSFSIGLVSFLVGLALSVTQ